MDQAHIRNFSIIAHIDHGKSTLADRFLQITGALQAPEVEAAQGVEAQTLANAYLAVENNLEIIPVINKIDLPSAQPDECRRQIEDIIGLDSSTSILASAKEGTGVTEILEG